MTITHYGALQLAQFSVDHPPGPDWINERNADARIVSDLFAISTFTSASIVFADNTGKLTEDNTNLRYQANQGLQLGRTLSAQNHGILRLYRSGVEKWRVGLDASDQFAIMQGAGDAPAITVGTSGQVYFPPLGTTASAANAFLNSGSTPANQLLRSTSSRRYKHDIQDLVDSSVLDRLRPITYRSLAEADDPMREWYGFIAEEVHEVDPRLVHYARDPEGAEIPDGVQYDRVVVLLVAAIHRLTQRIQRLEEQHG